MKIKYSNILDKNLKNDENGGKRVYRIKGMFQFSVASNNRPAAKD